MPKVTGTNPYEKPFAQKALEKYVMLLKGGAQLRVMLVEMPARELGFALVVVLLHADGNITPLAEILTSRDIQKMTPLFGHPITELFQQKMVPYMGTDIPVEGLEALFSAGTYDPDYEKIWGEK